MAATFDARTSSHSVTTPRFQPHQSPAPAALAQATALKSRVDGDVKQRRFIEDNLRNGEGRHLAINRQLKFR
jgi:hypothetical protein